MTVRGTREILISPRKLCWALADYPKTYHRRLDEGRSYGAIEPQLRSDLNGR